MATLSQLDINTYLQLARCCYSDLSVVFANDLNYGRKCTIKDRLNLAMLGILLEILDGYNVGEDDNCYTEEEIQTLIQNIGILTGICFKPIGYSYQVPEGYTLIDGVLIPD